MTPTPAHMWHTPCLANILWDFSRTTDWLPAVRSRQSDLRLMAKIIWRGWVRILRDRKGPAAFIARDGEQIHALYVHSRARGKGFGTALLSEAKSITDPLELWVVEANEAARQFYLHHGFVEVERGYGTGNDENLMGIRMVWTSEGGTTQ